MSNYIELGFCDQKYYDFPNIVNLEVFRGACPCECVHCPVGLVAPNDRGSRFGQATIDLATFRKVIDGRADPVDQSDPGVGVPKKVNCA